MRWIRPHHTRWLAACLLGLLLSVWAGGLSFTVVLVFTIIFATGAALIALDLPTVPEAEAVEEPDAGDDVVGVVADVDDVVDDAPADSSG